METKAPPGPRTPPPGVARELLSMMVQHRKYWLLPALAVMLLTAVLIAFAASGAAPFLYTLF